MLEELKENRPLADVPAKTTILVYACVAISAYPLGGCLLTLLAAMILGGWQVAVMAGVLAVCYVPYLWIASRVLFPANFIQRAVVTAGLSMSGLLLAAGYSGISGSATFDLRKIKATTPANELVADADGKTEIKWGQPDYPMMGIACALFVMTIGGAWLLRADSSSKPAR
jgi:hypothetical protein